MIVVGRVSDRIGRLTSLVVLLVASAAVMTSSAAAAANSEVHCTAVGSMQENFFKAPLPLAARWE